MATRILSFNVNGIRAILNKGFAEWIQKDAPDVLCLQETKAQPEQIDKALFEHLGYHVFINSAERKGYSGTAILSKNEPISYAVDIGEAAHDTEGRVICLEFDTYFLITVYVPNSGNDLKRLTYRQTWDKAFFKYLKTLEQTKPVLVCGDFNVAHKPIDLARPKPNYNKSAGYMQEEIDGMDRYTQGGLVDTFRHFYPDVTDKYSWWSYRAGARTKNVGWRIDYFLASDSFMNNIQDAFILHDVMGSDHCPVGVVVK